MKAYSKPIGDRFAIKAEVVVLFFFFLIGNHARIY